MARTCVFCGAPKVTREHALPAWLSTVLPGEGAFTIGQAHRGATTVEQQWTADALNKTVKRVCRRCNGTWMSDLETAAQAVLTPLIRGETKLLPAGDHALAVTWAVKTSMMCELVRLGDDKDFTPSTHLREVFDRREPPAGSQVWIGAYSGSKAVTVHQDRLLLQTSTAIGTGFATTMTFGRLLFQTFWYWDYPDGISIEGGPGLPKV